MAMFDQTFVEGTAKTHKTWTVMLSFVCQILAIIVLILIPLIYTDALPKQQLMTFLVAPPPPPPTRRNNKNDGIITIIQIASPR